MRSTRSPVLALLALSGVLVSLAEEPPCGLVYGTDEDRQRIQAAMLNGSSPDVRSAIDAAKSSRGVMVGCPQQEIGHRPGVEPRRPTVTEARDLWSNRVQPELDAFEGECPGLGRGWPALALAAYQVRKVGVPSDLEALARIAEATLDQQYTPEIAPGPLVTTPGVFGVLLADSSDDPCRIQGAPGQTSAALCSAFPHLCPRYCTGRWAGRRFAVTDHARLGDRLIGDPGGLGFDQGWIVAMLIEAALQQPDPDLRRRCRTAALQAAAWSLEQPLVTNHNYTSKLIWLLAQTYALTGRLDLRAGLLDRLSRNLVPGILTDLDHDGLVDGVHPPIPFDQLSRVAATPGRMWDGHNSLPWYHSMNAWAMVEAYVALRDRGDLALAAHYRPLAVAMVDSLAREILLMGTPVAHETGWMDTPFSILLALWKVARSENDPHPLWEQAAWVLWSSGALEVRGPRAHCIGWYLPILENAPYRSLPDRLTAFTGPRLPLRRPAQEP